MWGRNYPCASLLRPVVPSVFAFRGVGRGVGAFEGVKYLLLVTAFSFPYFTGGQVCLGK